ncbi:hypothetical protein [Clostridium tyrobutyricum]|uniref:hypothetical protein n=1 Tax=Clostridium tyrobutyricum TaxID=1519 RepID=UPI0002F1D475|nr:hypothetical protein [Clostridium tyrobutyricum]MEA5009949.1 hypothetical protein [Clostridium tyrobutyricum]
MKRKIFIEGKDPMSRAYIGWQDNKLSLYGLKQGYKKSADDLVDIAIEKGQKNRIDVLDTYIFPIMHSYRHSIEISLKLIYNRTYGKMPKGQHNIGSIWNESVVGQVIKDIPLNIEQSDLKEIKELIGELQGQDSKADVWRYLMNKEGSLYFTKWKYIDYQNLKNTMDYLYNYLDAIYCAVDEILSM